MSFNKTDYTLAAWKMACILRKSDAEDTTKDDWEMPVLDSNGYYNQDLAIEFSDMLMNYKDELELTDEQVTDALLRLEYIINLITEVI